MTAKKLLKNRRNIKLAEVCKYNKNYDSSLCRKGVFAPHPPFRCNIFNKIKMNKYFTNRLSAVVLLLALCTAHAFAGKEKKEVYIPMDYSTCGYHASERSIPDVKNAVFVSSADGDCHERLQRAINYVASLKADKSGFRGAILLGEGTFNISKPLRISKSGIVIRGAGREKTIINKLGTDRGALLYIEGDVSMNGGDTLAIAGEKVKAGTSSLTLKNAEGIKVGERIRIVRPSTKNWIADLRCEDYGGGLSYTGWKEGEINITWDRTVTSVNGNTITFDSPITTTLDQKYGLGFVITGHNTAELTECGVENLTLTSEHNSWNEKDEDHCWDAIWVNNARDCWVRRVNFRFFAGSAVNLQKETSRITVEDCIASDPVSEVGGWRRGVFITRGQQTLVQRCVSRHGIHDFAAGFCAAGPNAFVQCEGENSLGFSGSIGSWAAGLLFDIVNIDGNDISFKNLEQFQFGTGWNTANSMLWQCTASTIWCYSPDSDNRSSANGCWGTLTGNGEWTSSNDHVQPRSLFYAQLQKRLGEAAVNGYVLPRSTNASSSPEIEQAVEMARISLTEPRLTMEMWIDSVPYTANTSAKGVKSIDNIKGDKFAGEEMPAVKRSFAIVNGHITADGSLITGNRYQIPWWSGRVKDDFVQKSAKPAITRFVPGREGTGWTDRIDSVVNFLDKNGFCMLDHNYGLWYDLRRTDHERIRRADGDVWAPFYEQPFSRTGKGTGWDGLSLYDLTKPNKWYWMRLNEFAEKGAEKGIMLFHENYFQHNIIEAGAHWVDCPWRPVNNVNGTNFPEPVPFTGDKRVFMAEQFYDVNNPVLRPLHKQYIRMCLDQLKDHENVVQLISEEYTGPLHFTKFWLETVAEWEAETGRHPLVALSCTKDAQDAILADPVLSKVVDIIDIRYWHYNTNGLWAPPAGKSMAPRQFMRKMKVGKTGFAEAYKAVKEYRVKYPEKAVTFFAQQYPQYGWAILMAGGSCPNVPVTDNKFLADAAKMSYISGEGDSQYQVMGASDTGYVVYSHKGSGITVDVEAGKYTLHTVNPKSGDVKTEKKNIQLTGKYTIPADGKETVYWLERL